MQEAPEESEFSSSLKKSFPTDGAFEQLKLMMSSTTPDPDKVLLESGLKASQVQTLHYKSKMEDVDPL